LFLREPWDAKKHSLFRGKPKNLSSYLIKFSLSFFNSKNLNFQVKYKISKSAIFEIYCNFNKYSIGGRKKLHPGKYNILIKFNL